MQLFDFKQHGPHPRKYHAIYSGEGQKRRELAYRRQAVTAALQLRGIAKVIHFSPTMEAKRLSADTVVLPDSVLEGVSTIECVDRAKELLER